MSNLPERSRTPEEVELELKQAELKKLESEFAQRQLDLETLRGELSAFEREYLRVVGVKLAELDEIEAEIAELLAKANPKDSEVRHKAEAAREHARNSADAAREASEGVKEREFKPSDELKKLYREVAKQIHPDLANDESEKEKRHHLMAEASEAYRNGDIARLQQILKEWQHSPESVKGQGAGADLVRVIRKAALIRNRISLIDAEIQTLTSSDLYELKEQVFDAKKSGRNLLEEMASSVQKDILSAKSRLTFTAKKATVRE